MATPRRSSHTGCGRVVAEGGGGGFWGLPRPPVSSLGDLAELGVSRVGTGRGGDSWAWPRPRVTGWEDWAWELLCPAWCGGGGDTAPCLHWPEPWSCERTLAVGEALCLGGTPAGLGGGRGRHWEVMGRWSWGGGQGVSQGCAGVDKELRA